MPGLHEYIREAAVDAEVIPLGVQTRTVERAGDPPGSRRSGHAARG